EVFPSSIAEAPEVHSRFDRAVGQFTASCANATIKQACLLDASGRQVQVVPIANTNTVRFSVDPLPPGIYLLSLHTDRGPANLRFPVEH
ncbi:MAG TPA: T9SS type A sorting domain-containing protein, partial [Flavobacteriales bacterium]|nr:T9SS type A sorting domain-containing protein [Flavobacteriales bacterium]